MITVVFLNYYDGLLLANSGFEDFTRVKVYVAYFTINHSYIFIYWCSVIITIQLITTIFRHFEKFEIVADLRKSTFVTKMRPMKGDVRKAVKSAYLKEKNWKLSSGIVS